MERANVTARVRGRARERKRENRWMNWNGSEVEELAMCRWHIWILGLLSDRSCIGHANDSKLILNGDNMEEPVILGTTKHSTIVTSNWILTYSNSCWSRRSLNRSLFARKAAWVGKRFALTKCRFGLHLENETRATWRHAHCHCWCRCKCHCSYGGFFYSFFSCCWPWPCPMFAIGCLDC